MLINNITEVIGNTPLLKLNNIMKKFGLNNNIYAKLEYFNPGFSIKDRPAFEMIKESNLAEGGTVIEATSGNTGIGLALACIKYNYNLIITMPENVSNERKQLLKALGATIILTPSNDGMNGAINKAKYINETTNNSIYVNQFENTFNYLSHYKTTSREIYSELDGNIDFFISAIGSGGTITGCGKYFKEKNNKIQIVGVEPFESSVLSGFDKGSHGISGIGAGFIPKILDMHLIDDIIRITTDEAYEYARYLTKYEGVLAGISAGANLLTAIKIDQKVTKKNIVIIIPDNSERYISSDIYKELE